MYTFFSFTHQNAILEITHEVLKTTNLPTFLTLFKNVICIKTSVCPNITLVGNCSHIETLPRTKKSGRGRSVHVLTGGCEGGSQVFLSLTLSSFTFIRHIYHIYYHISCLLTGPLCMLNAHHITPIITI
jgi:hypothetical protein